jgi:hypothetical protein
MSVYFILSELDPTKSDSPAAVLWHVRFLCGTPYFHIFRTNFATASSSASFDQAPRQDFQLNLNGKLDPCAPIFSSLGVVVEM